MGQPVYLKTFAEDAQIDSEKLFYLKLLLRELLTFNSPMRHLA